MSKQSKERKALLAELDWCIREGFSGPRSASALEQARAALSNAGDALTDLELAKLVMTIEATTIGLHNVGTAELISFARAILRAAPAPVAAPASEPHALIVPEVIARRPLLDEDPDWYRESDNDYAGNNMEAVVWFLDNRDNLAALLAAPASGEAGVDSPAVNKAWQRFQMEVSPKVDDLSALVRQLVHALRKATTDHDLPDRAMDYLRRHGAHGSPLRAPIAADHSGEAAEMVGQEGLTVAIDWLAQRMEQLQALMKRTSAMPIMHEWQALNELRNRLRALLATPAAVSEPRLSDAAREVFLERVRQQSEEGWTPEHDDAHEGGELADAAAALVLEACDYRLAALQHWPWANSIKDAPPRRNLVKAGALILAEIERIDRAALRAGNQGETRD